MVAFLLFVVLDLAGLLLAPSYVVPGIQNLGAGQTVNQDLDAGDLNWTFEPLSTPVPSGSYRSGGGDPGGYLEMVLPPGTNVGGMWYQKIRVSGSAPFVARLRLDVLIQAASPFSGRLVAAIEPTPNGLQGSSAVTVQRYNRVQGWTATPTADLSESIPGPGTYYLKVAFLVESGLGDTTVGLDNVRLSWFTDAAVYFYLPLPLPVVLFISQDKALFLGYYVFLIAAIVAACAYHGIRERKLLAAAFLAPLDAIGTRLRSMSAWIAVGQTWLAVTFFQVAVFLFLIFAGTEPTSPINVTDTNVWVVLYELANASVYEELVFRALLIGVPMALASLLYRRGSTLPGESVGNHGWRDSLAHVLGGKIRRTSSREALLAAWILLFVSSALFGAAHAPGWGWWKVLPAMVAGLAFGYLFLRHGLGASIIAHFVNDYASTLVYMNVGGVGLDLFVSVLFLALAIAGSGFFVWYILHAWEEFRLLLGKFGWGVRRPAPAPSPPPPPTYAYGPAPPASPATPPPPPYPATPPTPPPYGAYGPAPEPSAPPAFRDPTFIPRDYVPTYHPPPYGYPPVRFLCPACGWVEARYEDRRFTCLRCGRTA